MADPIVLPRVILTTTASVDGRIAMDSSTVLMQPGAAARWQTMKPDGTDALLGGRRAEHGATATLEGSGSFVVPGRPPRPLPDVPSDHAGALRSHWIPRTAPHWFVAADSRGRVDWTWAGDEDTALVVLVCAATPLGYMQRLRELGIGYLIAGEDRVDLRLGLGLMREVLGATIVVADSGGTINASLLREGLVDEIDIVTLPGLVGGLTTPSIMDGDEQRRPAQVGVGDSALMGSRSVSSCSTPMSPMRDWCAVTTVCSRTDHHPAIPHRVAAPPTEETREASDPPASLLWSAANGPVAVSVVLVSLGVVDGSAVEAPAAVEELTVDPAAGW